MLDVKSRLQDLKSVAEKLAIEIEIVNLNNQEFQMQSGYCKMNGKDLILLDKNISLQEQSEILLQTLKNFDLEDIYVASWIREFIELEGNK
ncbi:MAG: hypothetical protein MKZ63_02955 [Nitrospinales bacterium]|jgi:hypothetical protein|uniref:Uncharacterized protein n=1 Tax=marine metagenome TaxID=408172 RepID=A0A381MYM1_9ZZZZ|nr:hypothetical protein [Nitrospinales bacterium]|tara:strand:- start:126 stop:398 length:273 start_codon:yes stop_codon:yes gene_type:complete